MSEEENKVEVKTSTLRIVLSSILRHKFKLQSVLRDHYKDTCILSEPDLLLITEIQISAMALTNFIEASLEEINEPGTILMTQEEIETMTILLGGIEACSKISFGPGLNLQEH